MWSAPCSVDNQQPSFHTHQPARHRVPAPLAAHLEQLLPCDAGRADEHGDTLDSDVERVRCCAKDDHQHLRTAQQRMAG